MKSKVKKYLKEIKSKYGKEKIKELVNHSDLTDDEQWLIYYTYGEDRYVINIALKLHISERQYYTIRDQALIKLYYILNL